MIECPNCGAMVEEADLSCRYCSHPLKADTGRAVDERFREEPPRAPQPPPQSPPQPERDYRQSYTPPHGGRPEGGPPPYGAGGWGPPPSYSGQEQPPHGQYPPYPQAAYVPNPQYRDISKIAAGILGILLGGIGVHKFYTGRIGLGIVYVLFCWTGIPAVIGLIEGIIYLTMDDIAFREKYARKY